MRLHIDLNKIKASLVSEWRVIVPIVLANVVYAFAVRYFTLPYRFPDMGVSGVAVLSYYALGISPNWVIVGGNVLLLLWGRRELSTRLMLLSMLSIGVFSLFLALFERFPLPLPDDRFMATVITGFLKGVSTGAIFNAGGSGGGFDIIAMVLRRRHGIEVGRFSIVANSFILILSLGVVGLEAIVYGAVGIYVYGETLDHATRAFDRRKQALIITNIPDEVSRFISSKGKGVPRVEGKGGYTGQPRRVLISLLEPRQVLQLKRFLKEEDPTAFVSICDASEVLGAGFKSWRSL